MFSFNEIIKATDKFYALAMSGKLLSKFAAPPEDRYSKMWDETQGEDPDDQQEAPKDLYTEMEENIWDQLQNEELANQFEAYLKAYQAFINSLQISPQQFAEALSKNEEAEETWVDHLDILQKRYERLVGSPYLQLNANDPKWEENLDPSEIRQAIEQIATDANNQMYAVAAKANLSPEDIDETLKNNSQNSFMAQTEELKQDKETDFANRQQGKQKEYAEKAREKRRTIGKIGVDNINRQKQRLQEAIETETNDIKKQELIRRLKALPNTEAYVRQLEKGRAKHRDRWENDPKFVERGKERQRTSRIFERKIAELTAKYDNATNGSYKNSIKEDVVRLKKELLKKHHKNIDFDDEWIRHNPAWQFELDPLQIMKDYHKREELSKEYERKHHQRRQTEKAKGELKGLVIQYRERVNNMLKDVKDKLNRQIAKAPEMKPLKDAIEAAKKTGDQAQVAKALEIAQAYIENFKKNHPLTKAVEAAIAEMRGWRDKLDELDKSKALDSDSLSEGDIQKIRALIEGGIGLIRKYPSNAAATKCATDIVQFLAQRIEL
jgi:hypothetical protein